MKSEYYQVAIVGAGPAGCSAALWTARLCPALADRTIVFEKDRHPRTKVCAGGLTLRAMEALARMGLSLDIPHTQINHIRLLFENHRLDLKRPGCMNVVRRNLFDAMLCAAVKAAGIEVHEEERATDIRLVNEAWIIETTKGRYRAKVLVGADGSRGLTHRLLPAWNGSTAVGLAVDTPETAADGHDFDDGRVTVDFTCNASGIPGYIWHFPFVDGAARGFNRGIYACSLNGLGRHGNLADALREGLRGRGTGMSDRVLGGFGVGYSGARPIGGPGVMLAGDAAGGNIFTGEGISQALRYGRLAAEAIAAAFSRKDFSFRSYASRVASSELGVEMRDAWRMASEFYTGGPAIALTAMEADGALAALIADYMSGARTFRSIRRETAVRMIYTCLKHGVPSFGKLCGLFVKMARRKMSE
jgi:flavin-dependent dehydrogenase